MCLTLMGFKYVPDVDAPHLKYVRYLDDLKYVRYLDVPYHASPWANCVQVSGTRRASFSREGCITTPALTNIEMRREN